MRTPQSEAIFTDNVEYMKSLPDKCFDLALVDPEYRDENAPDIHIRSKGGMDDWFGAPKADYFIELFRVSRHQIIFGGNYFTDILNPNTGKPFLCANNSWFIWDKMIADGLHFSMGEMAWVSEREDKKINLKIFRHRAGDGTAADWHPTAKPTAVYKYLLKTYAAKGWKILDTNLGSGSSRIAAYAMGFDFVGLELNEKYISESNRDFERYKEKDSLMAPQKKTKFSLED